MSLTVRFINVGRGKKSWEKQMYPDLDEIAKEARNALASRDVWAEFNEDSLTEGYIGAGFHTVGQFKVVQP